MRSATENRMPCASDQNSTSASSAPIARAMRRGATFEIHRSKKLKLARKPRPSTNRTANTTSDSRTISMT